MNHVLSPIAFTTSLSLVLHAALLAVVLPVQEVMLATGKGINIELVSSTTISDYRETEQAARKALSRPQRVQAEETALSKKIVAARNKQAAGPLSETLVRPAVPASVSVSIDEDTGTKVLARSTNAAVHNSSIIELLHTKISERKQYPYLAKRQRREGVARVEFVLNPDGSINDTRLVNSSRVRVLDQAALEAVRGIEPFEPAKAYLHRPEAFQVDIVFNMI